MPAARRQDLARHREIGWRTWHEGAPHQELAGQRRFRGRSRRYDPRRPCDVARPPREKRRPLRDDVNPPGAKLVRRDDEGVHRALLGEPVEEGVGRLQEQQEPRELDRGTLRDEPRRLRLFPLPLWVCARRTDDFWRLPTDFPRPTSKLAGAPRDEAERPHLISERPHGMRRPGLRLQAARPELSLCESLFRRARWLSGSVSLPNQEARSPNRTGLQQWQTAHSPRQSGLELRRSGLSPR